MLKEDRRKTSPVFYYGEYGYDGRLVFLSPVFGRKQEEGPKQAFPAMNNNRALYFSVSNMADRKSLKTITFFCIMNKLVVYWHCNKTSCLA